MLGDIQEEEEDEDDEGAFRIVPTPPDGSEESGDDDIPYIDDSGGDYAGESTSLLFADKADSNV